MLGNLEYPVLLWYNKVRFKYTLIIMPSKKASGADNQQERLKFIGWIVGFVDGA